MWEEMPEELFTIIKKLMEKSSENPLPLSRLEEQRLELFVADYKSDTHIRAWVTVAMDIYARAVVERKTDMFIDGFLHLTELLFVEERSSNSVF